MPAQRVLRGLAILMTLFLAVMTAAARAQEINFGPSHSLDAGGTISFDVPIPAVAGDGILSVTLFGDLNTATEFVTVFVDGTSIGTLGGGTQCGPDVTETLTIPAAIMVPAAADGSVTVLLDASDDLPGVDGVDDFCNAAPPYSSAFNFGDGVSIAARGSLNFTAAAPPAGDSTTQEDMMATRAAMIQLSGLDAVRRVDRLQSRSGRMTGALSFDGIPLAATNGVAIDLAPGALGFATGFDLGDAMIWAEGRVLSFSDDLSDEGRFAVLHLGADWIVAPDVMLGLSMQLDRIEQEDIASGETASGTGWMIGPVATLRLSEMLFVDARLAYGTSRDEIDRGATQDSFDSRRALAEVSVLGFAEQGATTVYPEFELSYYSERADTYESATLGTVAAREFSIGQAKLGGTVEHVFPLGQGDQVVGYLQAFATYSHRFSGAISLGSYVNETEGWTGEVEIGARYSTRSGARIDFGLGTAGLFSDAEAAWARFGVNVPLQ